jgi:hypothetical protein
MVGKAKGLKMLPDEHFLRKKHACWVIMENINTFEKLYLCYTNTKCIIVKY